MRTLPVALLTLSLLVAGCGSEGSDGTGRDQASEPASSDQDWRPDGGEPELLTLITQSHVGGHVDPVVVSVDGQAALERFAVRFEDKRMGLAIEDALAGARVPGGQVPGAAVVAVACASPSDVVIEVTDDGVEVTAGPVKSGIECLVPVTTVALIAADPADL